MPTVPPPGRHRRETRSCTELAVNSAAGLGRLVTALALVVLAGATVATASLDQPEPPTTVVSGGGR